MAKNLTDRNQPVS